VRWGSVRDGLEERMKGMGGKAREGVEGLKEETQK
jgi:hypothetical protein